MEPNAHDDESGTQQSPHLNSPDQADDVSCSEQSAVDNGKDPVNDTDAQDKNSADFATQNLEPADGATDDKGIENNNTAERPSEHQPETPHDPALAPEAPLPPSSEKGSNLAENASGAQAESPQKEPRFSKRAKLFALVAAAALLGAIVIANTVCFHPTWTPATCTKPKTCTNCGATADDALGHKWSKATCTKAKICKRCGVKKGAPLGHQEGEWSVESEASCAVAGTEATTCKRCGEKLTRQTPKLDHQPGDWTVTVQPTTNSDGTRVRTCTVCGAEVESETFAMSPEELAAAYKAECASVSYDEVARNPDQYDGAKVKFTGEVIQVMEDSGLYTLRVDVTKTSWGYDDTVLVHYVASDGAPRILEDDVITLYGTMGGMTSYESVMGATITLPVMYAQYVE